MTELSTCQSFGHVNQPNQNAKKHDQTTVTRHLDKWTFGQVDPKSANRLSRTRDSTPGVRPTRPCGTIRLRGKEPCVRSGDFARTSRP